MTFTFPASFSQHYSAYRTAFHRQPAAWFGYAFFILLPLGLATHAVVFAGWTPKEVWRENWGLLLSGPVFALVGLPLLHRMNVRQQRTGNAALSNEQNIAFSEDSIRTWGPLHNSSVLWKGITRVVETRKFFLIYFSEVHFLFLPKSAAGDRSTLESLRDFLRSHLGDRATLISSRQAAT